MPLALDGPKTLPAYSGELDFKLYRAPDYGYQLEYLIATNQGMVPAPLPILPIPPGVL